MGGSKATSVSNDQAAFSESNAAMNNREQTYADQIQKYYNPEVVSIDPNKVARDTIQFNQLRKYYDEQGLGDENYAMREKVRGQINEDLGGISPEVQRDLIKTGMAGAFLGGNRSFGRGLDRGSVTAANIFGRGAIGYRQGVQDQATRFMGANPSQSALASGGEMASLDIINRQNYADARNQKMGQLANISWNSINNENNRNQQTMGMLRQNAANEASNRNAIAGGNAASKGAMVGGGIAALGTAAAAAAIIA